MKLSYILNISMKCQIITRDGLVNVALSARVATITMNVMVGKN